MGTVVRRWNLMEEFAQRLQQLETQVGQQRAVIEHQQEQLMRQQTTIDAERAARTPVNPAQDARINLADLRVGNKPETFAGETHEWKGWSFKMRQYIAAVDEEIYLELVNVEANLLREMPLAGMNEPHKRRARQHAFMLTMHTKRSCTSDDHETERSSEWMRNLETFSGRMGAGSQRTVPSDADAVAAVSVCGRQTSGLGGVGTTCATVCGTEFRHASGHDQGSNTGTQPTRSRMTEACWSDRDEAARI